MKPLDVKSSAHIDFNVENNNKNPKFKVGDHVIISKDKNIFTKCYIPNRPEEVLGSKKLKILCREHMLLVILVVKKPLECFMKKNCKNNLNIV